VTSRAPSVSIGSAGSPVPTAVRAAVIVVLMVSATTGATLFGESPPLGADPRADLGNPAGAPRQGAELERTTDELARQLRCPVCQGLSVADSPSESASHMRAEAERLLALGYSPEQVIGYFESTYGEFVRLAPRARGLNLLVWLLPAAVLALGGLLIVRYVRRGASAPTPDRDEKTPEDLAPDLAEYRDRVRNEVGASPS
jgi:cytochrome c-type biogenesis protein CcmH